MENPLLKIVKRSKYVSVRPDKVNGVDITRMVVKLVDLDKIDDGTWTLMKLMDFCSGFYGYRVTITDVTINVRIGSFQY